MISSRAKKILWALAAILLILLIWLIISLSGKKTKTAAPKNTIVGQGSAAGTGGGPGSSGGSGSFGFSPIQKGSATGGAGGLSASTTQAGTGKSQAVGTAEPVLSSLNEPIRVTGSISLDEQGRPFSRFMEKGTGNIYEADLFSGKTRRLSITTIPLVIESPFASDGSYVFPESEKNFKLSVSFAAVPGAATSSPSDSQAGSSAGQPGNIAETPLADGISAFALGPIITPSKKQKTPSDTAQAFIIQDASDGGADGFIVLIPSLKKKLVWHSPLREWNASWISSNLIALTTKPSYQAPGFLYFLDPSASNNISPDDAGTLVFGAKNGLTTLVSPDGTQVAFSDNTDQLLLSSGIFNVKTGATATLPSPTIVADKCIWSADSKTLYCALPKAPGAGPYPDSWYQGRESFSDDIWQIDPVTQQTTMIIDGTKLSDAGIDATDLHLSAHGDFLIFTNKKDSVLWSVRIK